jgi:hypothetical protein
MSSKRSKRRANAAASQQRPTRTARNQTDLGGAILFPRHKRADGVALMVRPDAETNGRVRTRLALRSGDGKFLGVRFECARERARAGGLPRVANFIGGSDVPQSNDEESRMERSLLPRHSRPLQRGLLHLAASGSRPVHLQILHLGAFVERDRQHPVADANAALAISRCQWKHAAPCQARAAGGSGVCRVWRFGRCAKIGASQNEFSHRCSNRPEL